MRCGQRVDLVHDDRLHRAEERPAALGGGEEVERLGRGDEHVGRPAHQGLAAGARRVAGADRDAQRGEHEPLGGRRGPELGERPGEVLLDVVGEGAERRDVDDPGGVRQAARLERLAEEPVERGQEGRQRLARAGGGGDEDVPPRGDERPGLRLWRGGGPEPRREPAADEGVERLQHPEGLTPGADGCRAPCGSTRATGTCT
jgi:hypothetical protein